MAKIKEIALAEEKKVLKFSRDTYAQFGKLTEIREDNGYLHLVNEEGKETTKSKRYFSWERTKAKAEKYMGHYIITRTGAGWGAFDWFSDFYTDYNILDLPEDAGPEAQETIVKTRIGRWHLNEMYNNFREEMENETTQQRQEREEIIRRYEQEREQLTPVQRAELDDAVAAVEANWTEFVENPERVFNITGAAYNKGKPGHVDKSFALRYGLDVTSKKRLEVRIIEKLHKNYVGVELLDYDDLYARVAIKISNHRDSMGQWVIASADPLDNDHYKHERKLAPACGKDRIEPISWFLGVHKKIQNLL